MKRIALLMASCFLVFQSHIYPANAVDIPVLCADSQSFALRPSNVMKGCQQNELSLGEGPIAYSLTAEKKLNPILEVRFKAAQAAAKSEGINLKIVSGYRTFARQQYLFDQAVKKHGSYQEASKWVAPPELSHHPLGLAIDVNYPNEPDSAYWLEINGYKFGLCRVFKNEWWHFEGNIAPGWKCPPLLKNARALLKS